MHKQMSMQYNEIIIIIENANQLQSWLRFTGDRVMTTLYSYVRGIVSVLIVKSLKGTETMMIEKKKHSYTKNRLLSGHDASE